jgi:hypothetical protein
MLNALFKCMTSSCKAVLELSMLACCFRALTFQQDLYLSSLSLVRSDNSMVLVYGDKLFTVTLLLRFEKNLETIYFLFLFQSLSPEISNFELGLPKFFERFVASICYVLSLCDQVPSFSPLIGNHLFKHGNLLGICFLFNLLLKLNFFA